MDWLAALILAAGWVAGCVAVSMAIRRAARRGVALTVSVPGIPEALGQMARSQRFAAKAGAGLVHEPEVREKTPDSRMAAFHAWLTTEPGQRATGTEKTHLEACYAVVAGLDEAATEEERSDAREYLRAYGVPFPGRMGVLGT